MRHLHNNNSWQRLNSNNDYSNFAAQPLCIVKMKFVRQKTEMFEPKRN